MANISPRTMLLVSACLLTTIVAACNSGRTTTSPSDTLSPNQATLAAKTAIPPETPSLAQTLPAATPTDIFAYADNFGDGYISRIPIKEVGDAPPDEIMKRLLLQWLEHYKMECIDNNKLDDYTVDNIYLTNDPFRPQYEIIAMVSFSVRPVETPNEWVSLPTSISDDEWEHLGSVFGVFRDDEDFRLRLLPGWGT